MKYEPNPRVVESLIITVLLTCLMMICLMIVRA
ncbi:hypothetical protein SAMN05444359_12640 [Neolewinella agarilytica]|uniref:Uncharacterized protein n=1 Tax=Neolewinella agarilytica TaxID=478744 RepID=A0A1H9LYK5_9BACT|nr:hypothetical protein SAMN05444359_12640 [Neolewinella agarilytica]